MKMQARASSACGVPPLTTALLVFLLPLGSSRSLAATIYVDASATGASTGASWTDAYTDLQSALATGAGEFWVAAGIYTPAPPGGSRSATFSIQSGQQLYGGFSGVETTRSQRNPAVHATILSADLNGDDGTTGASDNSHHVLSLSGTDSTPVIDGFTIAGGSANFPTGARSQGGGVYLQSSSPTFSNCRFTGNFAHYGGAVLLNGGSPAFDGCEFSGNSVTNGRGGAMFNLASVAISGCSFDGNTVSGGSDTNGGGAIFSDFGASATVNGSSFTNNSATSTSQTSGATGGAISHAGTQLSVVNSKFSGNTSNLGGAIYASGSVSFENCALSSNQAISGPGEVDTGGIGGALMNAGGASASVSVVGCTVADNGANDGAGLAGSAGSVTSLWNTIVWGNADATGTSRQAQLKGPGDYAVSYSCVQNLFTADPGQDPIDPAAFPGSIAGDPMLLTDLHPAPGSPCIDAGDNTVVATATDLSGRARFFDDPDTTDTGSGTAPIVDMGAYEFSGAATDPCLSDTTPPSISCPTSVLVAYAGASCDVAVPDLSGDVVVSDNCTAVEDLIVQQNPMAGTLLGEGNHTIFLLVVDGAGLTASCIAIWRVKDQAFIRGNINARSAHAIDMGDVVDLVAMLFGGFNPGFDCAAAVDVNDDGAWNLLDVVALIQGLFGSYGYVIPPPVSGPGVATVDGGSVPSLLGCNQGEACP